MVAVKIKQKNSIEKSCLREREILYDIAYMWNLKKMIQMNLFTKQKQIHRLRE